MSLSFPREVPAMDRLIDEAAQVTGIDQVALRWRILIEPAMFVLLLLLASPALAQDATAPGWRADVNNGCKVWDAAPGPDETASWTGACRDGLAEGHGVVQWFGADKPIERDEGEYHAGKLDGRGVSVFPDGSGYDGQWRDSLPNGRGVYHWAGGNRYEGEWLNNRRHGTGIETFASGDRYEGQWRNDRPEGQGTLSAADKEVYIGNWSHGCFKDGPRRASVITTHKQCGFE